MVIESGLASTATNQTDVQMIEPYYQTERFTLYNGDCLTVLGQLPDCSVDAIVTDPPAGISFMGKDWDHHKGGRDAWVAWLTSVMRECLRVLKPGGHALVWALPRASHWTGWAIESAGFEVRDRVLHLFGSGFPKSLRVDMDERFCHCVANGHTNSDTFHAQGTDDRKHTVELLGAEVSEVQSARYANHEVQDSQGDYPYDCDSRDALLHLPEADGQSFVPSQEYAQAHNRSAVREDDLAYESSHSPSQAQYSDHPSSQDFDCPALFDSTDAADTQANIAVSENTPTQTDSAVLAYHKRRTASQSLAFPYYCNICGKPEAKGFGTALKPACEDWWLCRKPLNGTVAANVLKHGTGALNVDGCRVGDEQRLNLSASHNEIYGQFKGAETEGRIASGRWPANVTHDGSDEVVGLFPDTGISSGGGMKDLRGGLFQGNTNPNVTASCGFNDTGSAARFFYCSKPDRADREAGLQDLPHRSAGEVTDRVDGSDGLNSPRAGAGRNSGARNHHPTVKSTALMRWLCRLITPPLGTVLDPFTGSGSTGKAAMLEGFNFIGIELSAEYCELAQRRIEAALAQQGLFTPEQLVVERDEPPAQSGLFTTGD